MMWLDVIYAKVGEVSEILYNGIGNIGLEITKIMTEIGNIFGA